MQKDKELKKEIYSEVKKNWKNNFNDNWDYVLFGDESKINTTFKGHLNNYAKKWLPKKLYFDFIFRYFFKGNIEGLKSMYQKLEANYSKELLVKILTYRLIGHKKYKLPLSTPKYWEDLKFAETLIVERDKIINPDFLDFILYIHDLTPIGLPFKLYFTPLGILIDFIIKQYEYNQDGVMIKVNEGDVVIDAGGCWGDTALFFRPEGLNRKQA